MPKVYPTPTGTEKGGPERKNAGIKKTFGVYDRPVRLSSPAMLAAVVIAAVVVFIIALMLMRQ